MIAGNLLTRVEGHGSVELIRHGERIVDACFKLHESPRLFEKLLVGRRYDEVAEIACRICSICSTAHKVVSLRAMEAAFDVHVTPRTEVMRRLAVLGGTIESHALHLICLALPDYLNVGGITAVAVQKPVEVNHGLKIKSFGNLLQETIGGRAIHPFNLLPGGIGKSPSVQQLQMLAETVSALELPMNALKSLCDSLPPLLPGLPAIASAAADVSGCYLTTTGGETIRSDNVVNWLQQEQIPGSNALFSRFIDGTTYLVGPLARQKLLGNFEGTVSVCSSPQARLIELFQCMEEVRTIIDTLLQETFQAEEPVKIRPVCGEGVAMIEAPRGTLIHRYSFDGSGICTSATVITPTAINQKAIQESLSALTGTMCDYPEAEIRRAAEHLVRLFDPCISCAVH